MRRIFLLLLLFAPAVAPLSAMPPRFPITLASVAAALSAQAPTLAAASFQLPAVSASGPAPRLIIESITAVGRERAEIRVGCATTEECLPFLVTVRGALLPATLTTRPTPGPAPSQSRAAPVLRAGAHAVLRIDSGLLHITLPVIALAGGTAGDQIPVISEDRRVRYQAKIVSAALLEGSL